MALAAPRLLKRSLELYSLNFITFYNTRLLVIFVFYLTACLLDWSVAAVSTYCQIIIYYYYVDRGMVDESGDQFVAYFLPTEETLDKRRRDVEGEVDYEDGEESVVLLVYFVSFLLVSADNKKSMLREHKPPPIRRIRISDFGPRIRSVIRIATKIVSLGP